MVAQQNSDVPVVKQGHWTQKTDEELDKQDDVQLLRVSIRLLKNHGISLISSFSKTSLDELRMSQQPENTRPISSVAMDRLGQHSKTVITHPSLAKRIFSSVSLFDLETSHDLSEW